MRLKGENSVINIATGWLSFMHTSMAIFPKCQIVPYQNMLAYKGGIQQMTANIFEGNVTLVSSN